MGIHFERGIACLNLRRWQESVVEFTNELAEFPKSADSHAHRALALIQLGRLAEADTDAHQAISLAPEFSYAFYVLSIVALQQHRPAAAKSALQEALRLGKEARYFHLLAAIYFSVYDYGQCIELTQQALAIDPGYDAALIQQAEALAKLGLIRDAQHLLRAALSIRPENPDAHQQLGTLELQSGKAHTALNHLLEARRINPVDNNDQLGLAAAYGRLLRPLDRMDTFLEWLRSRSPIVLWCISSGLDTLIIALHLWIGEARPTFKLLLPVAATVGVANVLMLYVTFEWITKSAAMIRLRRELGIRMRQYFTVGEYVLMAMGAHGVATLLAVIIGAQMPLAYLTSALALLIINVFPLYSQLPGRNGSILAATMCVSFPIPAIVGAIKLYSDPAFAFICWALPILAAMISALYRNYAPTARLGSAHYLQKT